MLELDDVRAFCHGREIDLMMVPPPAPYMLCLHGEYDGYGDFFSILVDDVEYIELPCGLTVGDLMVVAQVKDLAALSPKWLHLSEDYSGSALALRSADAEQWGTGRYDFVIIAHNIEWRRGRDWAP